jgi:hypothetical protein
MTRLGALFVSSRRSIVSLFGLSVLSLALVQCGHPSHLFTMQVSPQTAAMTSFGETVQFKALGTYLTGNASGVQDVTNQVTWASSDANVATINPSGLATAVAAGSTTITASMQSSSGGLVTATAALTVSATVAPRDLTSITVIPGGQIGAPGEMATLGESTQFIAIGNYSGSPATVDLTDQVAWQSSDVKVATINAAGLAIGNNVGTTTITARATAKSGAIIVGGTTLTEQASGGGVPLPALTVYEVGLGSGSVAIPTVGTCTPTTGPAECTGNFVLGTTVTLTATPASGSCFAGWSANCIPDSPGSPPACVSSAASCSVVMNNNEPVGAIFNKLP